MTGTTRPHEVSQLAIQLGWVDTYGNSITWQTYQHQKKRAYFVYEEVDTLAEAEYVKQGNSFIKLRDERDKTKLKRKRW